jgi:RimJ/RimL family protein N-acetyltransferase
VIRSGPREIGTLELRLREVTPADSENLYGWRMDPQSRPMFRSTELVPFETHEKFFAGYFSPENNDHWFVIEADGRSVGAICLFAPTAEPSEAEWGRLVLAPEERGKGYARRALELLVEHARRSGIRKLRCEVVAGNPAAEAIYSRLGFREIGREEVGRRTFRYLSRELSTQ